MRRKVIATGAGRDSERTAATLDVSRQTISSIENGRYDPSITLTGIIFTIAHYTSYYTLRNKYWTLDWVLRGDRPENRVRSGKQLDVQRQLVLEVDAEFAIGFSLIGPLDSRDGKIDGNAGGLDQRHII